MATSLALIKPSRCNRIGLLDVHSRDSKTHQAFSFYADTEDNPALCEIVSETAGDSCP